MLVYLNIYIYLSLISIFNLTIENKFKNICFLLLFFFLLIFLSGKLYVGGDYISYLNWYNRIEFLNYNDSPKITFNSIILLLKFLNLDYFYLHFLSSIIFLLGIYKLAKLANEKLLFIVILIPFFIFVVGMGYIRQSMSIGFLFIAIYYWHKNYNITFLIFFIFSVFIHVSSLIFVFLVFFKQGENKIIKKLFFLILIFSFLFVPFYLIYYSNLTIFLEAVGANYENIEISNFNFLKYITHLFPLFLFIFFFKKFKKEKLYILYLFNLFYVISGILVLLFFKFNYPNLNYIFVIVERVLIPFILIEAFIFIKIYSYIKNIYKFIYKLNIIFYFGLQLYIWLAFAMNSHAWIPYRSIFLEW